MIIRVNHPLVANKRVINELAIYYEGDGDESHSHNIIGLSIGTRVIGDPATVAGITVNKIENYSPIILDE